VPAPQPWMRLERSTTAPLHSSAIVRPGGQPGTLTNLRSPHKLILMEMYLEPPMPIFEFVCGECQHHFEALLYGQQKPECPKCHATKLERQLSVFAVGAKGASASPTGACGACGDARGPGACSLGDMD